MAQNKILTVVSNGVKGVKGAGESSYRDGYVNITLQDIGFDIVILEDSSGTLSAAALNTLKNNLHNYIGYAPNADNNVYIFRLAVKNFTNWVYTANKTDLSGTMFIHLNTTTGAYSYASVESETQTELVQHEEDSEVHVSETDRANWDGKVSASVEQESGSTDNKLILS